MNALQFESRTSDDAAPESITLPERLREIGIPPGTLVGGCYRIERVLGAGGMGLVALAVDERLERRVAIKFVKARLLVPKLHAQFLAEARAMARLTHPNVLAVYAFGDHLEMPYFVMEYVEGRTAEKWLADRPMLPSADEVVRVLEQACLGVEAIHASGTVHRDLKPSNLLIDDAFRVAVGDFGVARPNEEKGGEAFVVGTPSYIAPEAAFGEPTTREQARDIYALGCIAYELFVGRPPFRGESPMHIMTQHVIQAPVPLSVRRPDLSPVYDPVVLKALAKSVEDRYATVAEFRHALLAAHEGTADPERILVVDDDPDWRELIISSLVARFPNAVIDQANTGEEALRVFREKSHSVVLVDLEMPEMDGTKLTAELRAIDPSRRTPIVVLTGAGGPSEWRRLSALGADAFLVKPVNADDVELVIRRTLRARGPTSALAVSK